MKFDSTRPLYKQIRDDLLNRIHRGEWKEGERIPTESEFVDLYKISRATIRHALGEIESDGIIERCPGKGTIVTRERIKPELLKITSFSKDMSLRGMTPKSITVNMDFEIPPRKVCEGFNLSKNEKVWRIKRLRVADNEPMGIQDLYIPPDLKISTRDMQNMQSFYQLLSDQYKLYPCYANESITATVANEEESKLLKINHGDPLIFIWRITFSEDRRPLEIVKILYIAKRYEYHLNLYDPSV